MKHARNSIQSFETNIAEEFHDVKKTIEESNGKLNDRIDKLADGINAQNRLFERELTKLNQNMESALKAIAEHEIRLTELENKTMIAETKTKTVGEVAKFGWFAAKFILAAGVVLGGLVGTARIWQILFPGS